MGTSQVGQTAMQLRLEQCGTCAPSTPLWSHHRDDRGNLVHIGFLRETVLEKRVWKVLITGVLTSLRF